MYPLYIRLLIVCYFPVPLHYHHFPLTSPSLHRHVTATTDPLSPGTVVKIVTTGMGPITSSVQVVTPGPVSKIVTKENVNVEAGMRDFMKGYKQTDNAKAHEAKPKQQVNTDDDW